MKGGPFAMSENHWLHIEVIPSTADGRPGWPILQQVHEWLVHREYKLVGVHGNPNKGHDRTYYRPQSS
jgi:hypothetical protein